MSRAKGYGFNRHLTNWLKVNGWPHAETRGTGLAGCDVVNTPLLAFEAKNRNHYLISQWMTQAEDYATDTGVIPVVVHKRPRVNHERLEGMGQQFATVTIASWAGVTGSVSSLTVRMTSRKALHEALTHPDDFFFHARRGADEWIYNFCTTTLDHLNRQLLAAGYGDPKAVEVAA